MRVAVSPSFLESVANHPRVLPNIGGGQDFRAGESWADTVAVEWDTGGVVFHTRQPGVYSAHLVFLPKTPDVLAKCREALRHLFTRTDAKVVTGTIPIRLRHARKVALTAGMKHQFDCDGMAFYRLTAQEWKQQQGEGIWAGQPRYKEP